MNPLFVAILFGCVFSAQKIDAIDEKGELLLRFSPDDRNHPLVSIGYNYEYDYLREFPPRRRVVRKDKALKAKPMDKPKSMHGNAQQEFSVAKADQIFYEMIIEEGWVKKNFDEQNIRYCRSFVYEFVCKLFNGHCPGRLDWPNEFMTADTNGQELSVFHELYQINRLPVTAKDMDRSGCHLEDFDLLIIFQNSAGKHEMLPPILHIHSGKRQPGHNFEDDAFATEEIAHGHGNEYRVRLKVFKCPGNHFFFQNLLVLDKTTKLALHQIQSGDLANHRTIIVDMSQKPIPVDNKPPKQAAPAAAGMVGGFF